MKVLPYYSSNQSEPHVHHNHSDCPSGQQIPSWNKLSGTGGLPRCEHCIEMG
jgi:hypothetical protein